MKIFRLKLSSNSLSTNAFVKLAMIVSGFFYGFWLGTCIHFNPLKHGLQSEGSAIIYYLFAALTIGSHMTISLCEVVLLQILKVQFVIIKDALHDLNSKNCAFLQSRLKMYVDIHDNLYETCEMFMQVFSFQKIINLTASFVNTVSCLFYLVKYYYGNCPTYKAMYILEWIACLNLLNLIVIIWYHTTNEQVRIIIILIILYCCSGMLKYKGDTEIHKNQFF